jgi:hypothetical protein
MRPKEIVERIMTSHYDIARCNCWLCREGRKAKCHPRKNYPMHPKEFCVIVEKKK